MCASYAYIDFCPSPSTASHNLQLGMSLTHYRTTYSLPYRGALPSNRKRRLVYAIFNTHHVAPCPFVYIFQYQLEENRSLCIVRPSFQLSYIKSMNRRSKHDRKRNRRVGIKQWHLEGKKMDLKLKRTREERNKGLKSTEEAKGEYKDRKRKNFKD